MDLLPFSEAKKVLKAQAFSRLLGTELRRFETGLVELALTIRPEHRQQHGLVHGGVLAYLVDNAITFAAGSVLGPEVLTVELKVNYLRPARGPELLAMGEVVHAGRRLAVCRAEVREGGAGPGHGGPQGLRWPAWTPSTPSSWGSCRG